VVIFVEQHPESKEKLIVQRKFTPN